MHTGAPDEHEMVANWQDPASLQSAPTTHAEHDPCEHTAPASHATPSVAVPIAVHMAPPSHDRSPVRHGAGLHKAPDTQAEASSSASAPPPSFSTDMDASGPVPPSAWFTEPSTDASAARSCKLPRSASQPDASGRTRPTRSTPSTRSARRITSPR